jgi:hypothetical protein
MAGYCQRKGKALLAITPACVDEAGIDIPPQARALLDHLQAESDAALAAERK